MNHVRITVLLACLLPACSGDVMETPGAGSPMGPPNTPGGGSQPAPQLPPSKPDPAFDPGPRAFRRLTHVQYANTIKATLGIDVAVEDLLGNDRALDGFANGDHQAAPSSGVASAYAAAAARLAQEATAPARRAALFDASKCGAHAACLDAFVKLHGRRLFRRPVHATELPGILTGAQQQAAAANDFWAGASFALEVMLQSVPFLYVIDVGEKDATYPSWLRRDPFSVATRLSLLLWNSGPDDQLLDRAAAGGLKTRADLEAQVVRMMKDPRAQQTFQHFFREWLGYDLSARASKDPVHTAFKPETVRALIADTDRLVAEFVAGGAPIMKLFDTDFTYGDPAVRQFYGATEIDPQDPARAKLPKDRRGVLGHASFIAANSGPGNPSPTLRGLAVLNKFLCADMPEPPPTAPAELPESTDKVPRTIRERTELYMLSNNGCNYCHNYMDPLGFLFENFDVIGKHRTQEPVTGAPGGSKPVDATGAILTLKQERVAGLPGLAAALSTHELPRDCMLEQVLGWSLGRKKVDSDKPLLNRLRESHQANGGTFASVMAAMATSDAVLYMRAD